jgi:Mor family transcriptional regulator
LSITERETIRAEAAGRSLRDLARAYGVSHETIRGVLRRSGAA